MDNEMNNWICPYCKKEVPFTDYCENCGADFEITHVIVLNGKDDRWQLLEKRIHPEFKAKADT
jgi:predicted amidophosphoribosyltransferase